MEAKLWSEEHEPHIRRINGDECAKQHEVIRDCGIGLLYVNVADIWRERDMTLSREVLWGIIILATANHKKSAEVVVVKKFL